MLVDSMGTYKLKESIKYQIEELDDLTLEKKVRSMDLIDDNIDCICGLYAGDKINVRSAIEIIEGMDVDVRIKDILQYQIEEKTAFDCEVYRILAIGKLMNALLDSHQDAFPKDLFIDLKRYFEFKRSDVFIRYYYVNFISMVFDINKKHLLMKLC